MIRSILVAAIIFVGSAAAHAQCQNCTPTNPSNPTAQAAHDAPKYVWVRRGLFRCRWVLMKVHPVAPGQVIGVAQR